MQFFAELKRRKVIQTAVLHAVAGELALRLLGGDAPKARPTDPRAYSLYLQGRHFFSLLSASGFERAIPALEGAPAIDPRFGPAWATLGALYWGQANNSLIPYEEGARRAREASEKGAVVRSRAGRADVAARAARCDRAARSALGLRRIERALALEPHNQRVLSRAADVARMRGRTDEAIRYSEQALEADPLSPNAHAVLGLTYYFAGRLDDAEAQQEPSAMWRLRSTPTAARSIRRLNGWGAPR